MFPKPIQTYSFIYQILYKIFLFIILLLWLMPILAILLTSARSQADIMSGNYWGIPTSFNLIENYMSVFQNSPIKDYLFNSFKITIPTVIGTVILSTMTGYAFAIYKFKSNLILFFMFIAGNFVPFQILMIPVRDFTIQMGLYDTISGMVFFHVAFQTGFCTLFMRNFIKALPYDLVEAARIEGVSEFKIFLHIMIPLLKPALAALSVLIFTFIWNDYFWAMVLVQSQEAMPITAGIKSLNGQWLASWHLISAGSIIAAFPPIIIFFLLQRYFIAGLTFGAVK